jgi:hypothetical protein
MGIDFLSDGRMVMAVTDFMGGGEIPGARRVGSRVLLVTNPTSAAPTITDIANTFYQPAGVTVAHNDRIYVSDRDGWYQIQNNNTSGGTGNRRLIHSYNWAGANWTNGVNWHQWVFSPTFYQGRFYAPYSGSIRPGGPSDVPFTSNMSGALLSWDTTTMNTGSRYAGGLRSPNGGSVGPNGMIMVADNQGSYLPVSTLARIKPNMFYGHQQTGNPANWAEGLPYDPPTAWLNHNVAQRRSPSQPLYVPSGPYQGDWILGDINAPGLMRVALDSVMVNGNWELNGYLSHFCQGFPGGLNNGAAAINRMKFAPDGSLYIGTFRSVAGNWSGDPTRDTYRLALRSPAVGSFEVMKVRSLNDGYEIEFSEAIDPSSAVIANFQVQQKSVLRQSGYGVGESGYTNRAITRVDVSGDNRRIHLVVPTLTPYVSSSRTHWVTYIQFRPAFISANGDNVYNDEAWHTLNYQSTRTWVPTSISNKSGLASSLGDKVWHGISGGRLRVNIELTGAYRATLRDMQGRLLSEKAGSGVGQVEFVAPRSNQALYLLEVRSGNGQYSKTVTF